MNKRIYLGEISGNMLNNPLENTNYLNILGLLPTLGTEIKKRVSELLHQKYNTLFLHELSCNNLAKQEILAKAKQEIISEMRQIEELTGNSKSIVVFGDDCFTNHLLIKLLQKILGENNFEHHVTIKNIDLSKPCDKDTFQVPQNTLVIFGGSLNDTYTIDESYYNGYFPQIIKNLGDDFDPIWYNNRVLGICFGQQYIANLLGIRNDHSSSIIATYRGGAQFGPSNCSLENYNYVSKVYQEALYGLSNFGHNLKFSTFFTRTGYVDFDLLKTGNHSQIIPLIKDDMTGSIVGWGTKNGNILGVQFHPEISFFHDRNYLKENIESILPYLSQYKNYEKLIENFHFDDSFHGIIQNDIGEHFYTFALLAFLKSIKNQYINLYRLHHNESCASQHDIQHSDSIDYQTSLFDLTKVVRQKIDSLLAISNPVLNDTKERLSFLKKIDESGRLLLNSRLDWKVNRGIQEVSKVLGIKDIGKLLEDQLGFLKQNFPEKKVTIFRDRGAGDGSLLKDLYLHYKGKDILFYGVGDYIYFDIYPSLKKKGGELGIPEDVIIMLFEEFLEHYNQIPDGNIFQKVSRAFEKTHLLEIHKIHTSSITGTDTAMFSGEGEHDISQQSIEFIHDKYDSIIQLKNYIIENFYSLFEGYFERIYVSKFNDFDMESSSISKVDFQVAIRSTSHIDGREYMKVILNHCSRFAHPGSIFIDNGIHRSYTGVPRIFELAQVQAFTGNVKFSLIYDEKTNYFPGVIIQKEPFHHDDFFQSHLQSGYKIVSLEEAIKTTFFKIEYFLRNFIVRNFKNYDVFWDFNKEIIQALKEIMGLIKENNIHKIEEIILNLINYIATYYKNDNITYDPIDIEVLREYTIGGESLGNIIVSQVYNPDWLNLDAHRKY